METKNNEEVTSDNVYLTLLNMFKSEDPKRTWMTSAFDIGDRTCATNGYCLISTPLQEGFHDKIAKVGTVYPIEHTIKKDITIAEIMEKLKEFPMVDCFDDKEVTCDACYGDGFVDFEFSHNHKDYTYPADCPVCEGSGRISVKSTVPNGKKEFDYTKFFQIGICVFYIYRIEELLSVADKLKAETITIVSQTASTAPTLFIIKDVELLMMPALCENSDDIAQSIPWHTVIHHCLLEQ